MVEIQAGCALRNPPIFFVVRWYYMESKPNRIPEDSPVEALDEAERSILSGAQYLKQLRQKLKEAQDSYNAHREQIEVVQASGASEEQKTILLQDEQERIERIQKKIAILEQGMLDEVDHTEQLNQPN